MKDIFIDENASVKTALKKIDVGAQKILFVTKENKLIGSLSDGDIRRAILKNVNFDHSIKEIFNKTPKFIKESEYSDSLCKKILIKNKIEVIPVINQYGNITKVVTWEDLFKESLQFEKKNYQQIKIPTVIMAGGKGTRMAPFTTVLPKPLIPIGEKTILEHIMEEYKIFGVEKFYFTVNYKGKMIKAYFDHNHNYNIHYLWEKEFYGTAGSLKLFDIQDTEDFFVSNCDIIVKTNYADVYNFHKDNNAYLTIVSSIQHQTFPYGVIEFKSGGKVTNLKEKPEFTFPINTGFYILNKKCLDFIPEKKLFHMTHLIETLIENNHKVLAYPVNEKDFIDIGQWGEYKNVINKMVL